MKTEGRSRHTVWMEDAVWQRVQEHYKSDVCSTQNEFIAKAIMFYCGYLQSEYAGDFLPKILGETLEAILSMFGDRIGKLLLKQTVEQNICNHIIASDTDSKTMCGSNSANCAITLRKFCMLRTCMPHSSACVLIASAIPLSSSIISSRYIVHSPIVSAKSSAHKYFFSISHTALR